jgi:hypothetical protein
MSLYQELTMNPPAIEEFIPSNPREVLFKLINPMGHVKHISFKKVDGDFEINTHGDAYSNFQIPHTKTDLEWDADENLWENVVNAINEGVVVIQSVRTR